MTLFKFAAFTVFLACGETTSHVAVATTSFDAIGNTVDTRASDEDTDTSSTPDLDVTPEPDTSEPDTSEPDTSAPDTAPESDAAAPVDTATPDIATANDIEPGPDITSDSAETSPDDIGVAVDPFAAPIVIDALPTTVTGDTTTSLSVAIASYACAPSKDESGPEVVYSLVIPAAGTLTLTLDDVSGDDVDVDVHLLGAPDPSVCLGRADKTLSVNVSAGPLWIAVDTWVQNGVPKPGPYTLTVSLADPDPCGPSACMATDLGTPNGVPVEPDGLGGCPAGMTRVDDFCIDRWEAALVTTAPEGPVTPYAAPTVSVRAVSAPGLVPSGYVSGVVASAACAASGKRLCTDVEWLRACQGPTVTTYPYGATVVPGLCNDARACHPAVQYFGTNESWIWSELDHPCLNQLPESLAATGAKGGCVSAEGVFDLVGNLHEWTADPAGTFRGGFYVDTKLNGNGCLYKTTAHDVSHYDYSTGFRCCSSAP
ncbi:MAG: SUMF1/EgtB/PvdO family nonheme iron enzyme [Myxococcales bacterium]|nr:SUMF1/EgtB/PvdO family nonheme iron enzyme [Myxococcales bacterium]